MQAFVKPLITRSTDRAVKRSHRSGLLNLKNNPFIPADKSIPMPEPVYLRRDKAAFARSPFQTALLVMDAQQRSINLGLAAYVCFLSGQQVLDVERLHSLRGSNPSVNLSTVLSRVKRDETITGVIIATWQQSTAEHPYASEFIDEVYRQYSVLEEAGIQLIDHLRISDTGMYSYYGDHNGPYYDALSCHEKSICRLY